MRCNPTGPLVPAPSPAPAPPRLLDRVRQTAAARGHAAPTQEAFAQWTLRLILFHDKRHPQELNLADVGRFLTHLAQTEKDPLRALEAAQQALEFRYRDVLALAIGDLPLPRPPRLLD